MSHPCRSQLESAKQWIQKPCTFGYLCPLTPLNNKCAKFHKSHLYLSISYHLPKRNLDPLQPLLLPPMRAGNLQGHLVMSSQYSGVMLGVLERGWSGLVFAIVSYLGYDMIYGG